VNALDLVGASRRELAAIAADHGRPFDPDAVAGQVYDGISLGLPPIALRLTWTKFAKAFHREPGTGRIRGWNIRIEQDALDRPWTPRRRAGRPVTFGHFAVTERAGRVELDYGRGGNRRLDPIGLLRDPIVAIDGPELLLGWSYLELAGVAVPTPSWFVLRRSTALAEIAAAPR